MSTNEYKFYELFKLLTPEQQDAFWAWAVSMLSSAPFATNMKPVTEGGKGMKKVYADYHDGQVYDCQEKNRQLTSINISKIFCQLARLFEERDLVSMFSIFSCGAKANVSNPAGRFRTEMGVYIKTLAEIGIHLRYVQSPKLPGYYQIKGPKGKDIEEVMDSNVRRSKRMVQDADIKFRSEEDPSSSEAIILLRQALEIHPRSYAAACIIAKHSDLIDKNAKDLLEEAWSILVNTARAAILERSYVQNYGRDRSSKTEDQAIGTYLSLQGEMVDVLNVSIRGLEKAATAYNYKTDKAGAFADLVLWGAALPSRDPAEKDYTYITGNKYFSAFLQMATDKVDWPKKIAEENRLDFAAHALVELGQSGKLDIVMDEFTTERAEEQLLIKLRAKIRECLRRWGDGGGGIDVDSGRIEDPIDPYDAIDISDDEERKMGDSLGHWSDSESE